MIRSALCEMLHIKYPVLQGGMAWIADAKLASAVSNAGGLGIISAMNLESSYLKNEIKKARELTDKPIGVNIMLMSPYAADAAKVVIEEKVDVVTTGAGLPTSYMPAWLKAGIKVIPVVPSTGVAKMVARAGAAAVIAEGGESGGHVGNLTTMSLLPQVCDAVDIPVIAAGGIADGRGFAAALMLGAIGVQCGTCFLVANECTVHENYKKKILCAKDIDTIVTGQRLGHPVRSLKNSFSRSFSRMEYDSSMSDEQISNFGAGALRLAAKEGDEKNGCFMAGQIAALVKQEKPVKDIIEDMLKEAEDILKGASKWVN